MKKNLLRSKIMVGLIVVAILVGCILGNHSVKSKADMIIKNENANEVNDEKNNKECYNEIIQEYRKDGVEISIMTLEDLYREFNNYKEIDQSLRENILAKTSDEVIIKFLEEEQKELLKISTSTDEVDICSDSLEQHIKDNDSNYVKNVESKYFRKGKDSYKKITTITSKYNGKAKITIEDESERDINTKAYTLSIDTGDMEQIKDYGNRKFSYTYNGETAMAAKATLGYTIGSGSLSTRYITGEGINKVSFLQKLVFKSKNINISNSNGIGQKIESEAIFQAYLDNERNLGKLKIVMSVKQGREAQHTSLTGMTVYQRAKVYFNPFAE